MQVLTTIKAALFTLAIGLCSCKYNHFDTPTQPDEPDPLIVNTNISDLQELYKGQPQAIVNDLTLLGYVTSDDLPGNFNRSLMIEHNGRAVEIMAGLYDLHTLYPRGQRIYVRAKGLTLGKTNGTYQLGLAAKAGSWYQTDYIGHLGLLEKYLLKGEENIPCEPTRTTVAGLTPKMCGTLVTIEGLRHDRAERCWHSETEGSYSLFADAYGSPVAVYTSAKAVFANATIPAGQIGITGILELIGPAQGQPTEIYALRIRDLNDISAF